MARKKDQATEPAKKNAPEYVKLSALLTKTAEFSAFDIWLVGDTPLITHAWSEKAKREMLAKQVKATRGGREARNPEEDFVNSLYQIDKDVYGFPVTGFKNAILSAAHKDKGIARSVLQASLFLAADMVRVKPAFPDAVCDMPIVRIYGSKPEMREDMVRVGSGLQKTASLAYRSQFTVWAVKLAGKLNTSMVPAEALVPLIQDAGIAIGVGEWRNERKGVFGAFHLANADEEAAWDRYAAGKGPLPVPASMQLAAE